MATIDRIKISQEINFNGMPTWIGLEGVLLPDENEKDGLRQLQKVITEYHNEEQQVYSKSNWNKGASKTDAIGSMINSIKSCTELNVLETYKLISKSNSDLQAAYDLRFSELSQ